MNYNHYQLKNVTLMSCKRINTLCLFIILSSLFSCKDSETHKKILPKFEPNWESLSKHEIPEWFKDAKFGLYATLGPYCVPAYVGEWYPYAMYANDQRYDWTRAIYKHHLKTYGEDFGYKDFIPMFKAEKFDADEWADLFKKAGARFAGPVMEHHDGFSMWDSKVNRWNTVDMGPKRNIGGELVTAVRNRGMKVLTTFHHSHNIQGYFKKDSLRDTGDPEYGDLYGYYKDSIRAHEVWFKKLKEVIDMYRPDQIWFDFGLADIPDDYKIKFAQYYYNKESEWHKDVIITRKGKHLPEGVGVLDVERGKIDSLHVDLWQTDDSVSPKAWSWVEDLPLKTDRELIHELIDIVSKNGVLLLNVCPKSDGTIPDDQKTLLYSIGNFLNKNGEAVYNTRPWLIHGEGPNLLDRGRGMNDYIQEQVQFDSKDIRFTRSKNGKNIYIFSLGWPEERIDIKAMGKDSEYLASSIKSVQALGSAHQVVWQQSADYLSIVSNKADEDNSRAYVWKVSLY